MTFHLVYNLLLLQFVLGASVLHLDYMLSALYAIARPLVCLFVRHTGGSVRNGRALSLYFCRIGLSFIQEF